MEQINLEEYRQAIIDSYTSYIDVMRHFDTSWCEDGIRRTKEAKTLVELEIMDDQIERAWDAISD